MQIAIILRFWYIKATLQKKGTFQQVLPFKVKKYFSWKTGTGIRRMIEDAKKHKCPEPKFTVNGFFTATFRPNVEIARKVTGQVGEQVSEQVDEQVTILKFCSIPKQKQEILAHLGLRSVYLNFKRHIQPLVKQGFLEMTIPEKPRSSKQRYRTTELGRKILAQKGGG